MKGNKSRGILQAAILFKVLFIQRDKTKYFSHFTWSHFVDIHLESSARHETCLQCSNLKCNNTNAFHTYMYSMLEPLQHLDLMDSPLLTT